MTKKLFIKKRAFFKKRLSLRISKDLDQRLKGIELRAKEQELIFPLAQHLVEAIENYVGMAEEQLNKIESQKKYGQQPPPRSDGGPE